MTAEYADAFPPPLVITGFSLDSDAVPAHSEGLVVKGPWSLPVTNETDLDEQAEDEADVQAALASLAEPGENTPMDVLFARLGL